MKKPKFTIVDYLIIICVVCAIAFAFIHISSDNDDSSQSISYDSSTLNKIVEKYLSFYREGNIIKTTASGYNASTGEKQEISGTIEWMDDDKGSNVKILINSNRNYILAGLYKDVPQADFYIEQISLETNGEKYENLTEITLSPKNITQLNDLISNLNNSDTKYEVSTVVTLNDPDNLEYQSVFNKLYENGERISIKSTLTGFQSQITITQATAKEINIANDILGNTDGTTDKIIIRIYNYNEKDIESLEKISTIDNIRKIS
ncbi:adhesin [Methanobrevibacter sp. OttesenSCG-928-K11]|nr:adhesin [Methanobrevibacter sp. OttesenSCG-928-K11]MDL2271087.1 adhesin [Methanobrevibacter sp. OttesenSCG-928-I08]